MCLPPGGEARLVFLSSVEHPEDGDPCARQLEFDDGPVSEPDGSQPRANVVSGCADHWHVDEALAEVDDRGDEPFGGWGCAIVRGSLVKLE
jgi:hypothetical protein